VFHPDKGGNCGDSLSVFVFLVTLCGLYAPAKTDGWTTFRDRTFILFTGALLAWMAIDYAPFAIVFGLVVARYRKFEHIRGVAIWAIVFAGWLLIRSLTLQQAGLVITAIVLSAIMQALLVIMDFVTALYYRSQGKSMSPISGTLGNRTYAAAYLAIVCPLVATKETWVVFAILTIGLACALSRAAVPAWFVGVVIASPKLWLILAILGVVTFCGIFFSPMLSSFADAQRDRVRVWVTAIRHAARWPSWLVGYGYDSFSKVTMKISIRGGMKEGFVHCHNDYIQWFYEYGVLGCLAVGWLFYQFLLPNMAIGSPLTGSVVAAMAISMATFPHHIAPIGMTILFLVAMLSKGFL